MIYYQIIEKEGTPCDSRWADAIRPTTLDEVVGQQHLLCPGGVLRRLIENGTEANMVFYGPSGTGKTTVANIIAQRTQKKLYRLNATTASLQDIKDIIADVGTLLAPGGILLYLDEIQYFNKKQQQSLLEFMENGSLTLIASTTENPYFYVYSALLSRSTVFEFKAVSPEEAQPAVLRALRLEQQQSSLPLTWEEGVPLQIATSCGGDVRKAINAVELLCQAARPVNGQLLLTSDDALQLTQRSAMRYDRDGDAHYDILSALQKSIRGSDPGRSRALSGPAAGGWGSAFTLPPSFGHRRGGHRPCLSHGHGHHQGVCGRGGTGGTPEARLPLAEAAILLATAPKSNTAHNAIIAAMSDLKKGRTGDIPRQLQNVHADTTGFDNQQHYLYPHDFPHRWVRQQYLPDALKNVKYYEWGDNKTEQAAKAYWEKIKGEPL